MQLLLRIVWGYEGYEGEVMNYCMKVLRVVRVIERYIKLLQNCL